MNNRLTKFLLAVFLIAELVGFLPSYGQTNESTISVDTLQWIKMEYSSPYKTLFGSPYNDSLIAIYENYPSGEIEIQFGNEVKPLNQLSKDKLIKTVYVIFKRWHEQVREMDEEYYKLYSTLVEMSDILSGKNSK